MKNKKIIIFLSILVLIILSFVGYLLLSKDDFSKTNDDLKEIVIVEKDIVSYQQKMDDILKEEINNKGNTLDNPYIKLNPYKISPLSAIIIFSTKYETDITYYVNDVEYKINDKSKKHIIPIYYLLADKDNKIDIKTNKENKTLNIKTDKLPEEYINLNVSVNNIKRDNQKYFMISPDGVSNVAYDYEGNVVWYLDGVYYGDMQILDNGHFFVNNGISNNVMGQTTGIVEMDLLGKIYNEYLIDGGVHHEVQVLDDGNYLIASSNPNSSRIFDYLYIIDKNGNVKKTIDLYEIVNTIDSEFAKTLPDTWAWNNSAFVDNNNLILSLRNRSSVLSIDINTLKINWIFGKESNWSSAFSGYFLNSVDEVYTQGQHTAYMYDGKLSVFDNGYSAELYENSMCTDLVNNYSSVKIFNIDGKNISLDKEFKTDRRMFSYALSSVYELDNGNRMINFGWEFSDSDYLDERCTTLTNTNLSSRILEVDKDFNILFDGTLNSGKYRAYKYNFNINKNYEIIDYKSYNNYGEKYYTKMSNADIDKVVIEPKKASITADFYTGFMQVSAMLDNKSELYFIFKSIDGKDNYKVITKKKDENMLNISYLPKLSGKYEVYYILDDVAYKYEELKAFN